MGPADRRRLRRHPPPATLKTFDRFCANHGLHDPQRYPAVRSVDRSLPRHHQTVHGVFNCVCVESAHSGLGLINGE